MKWEGNRESDNVEDRRSSGGGMPVFGGRSIGIGTIVIALLGGWALGINPLTILSLLSGGGAPTAQVQQAPAQRPPADDTMGRFVATVLADTEDVWQGVFREGGATYQEPRLVLFRGATPTACGTGQAAMGPFYCPADQKVYLDMSFFQEMAQRFKAAGDFAQAYVIAHEVGHHVQTLLGTVVFAALATAWPLVRFSGQTEIVEIVRLVQESAWPVLVLCAVLNVLATAINLASGWRGGAIFPLIFAGAAAGGADRGEHVPVVVLVLER